MDTFTTALEPGEIVREVIVPVDGDGTGTSYQKVLQPASGFAIVGIAVRVRKQGEKIAMARIGVTGLSNRAFRATGGGKGPGGQKRHAGRDSGSRGAGGAGNRRQLRSARFGRLPPAPRGSVRGESARRGAGPHCIRAAREDFRIVLSPAAARAGLSETAGPRGPGGRHAGLREPRKNRRGRVPHEDEDGARQSFGQLRRQGPDHRADVRRTVSS